jgi:hypothetical protein
MSGFCNGAISDNTGLYTLPSEANKIDTYKCTYCKEKVFLRQGEKNVHHFAHFPNSNCTHTTYIENESSQHNDAKVRIKNLLEKMKTIRVRRDCVICDKEEEFIVKLQKDCRVELEYRFTLDDTICIADVAILHNNRIDVIFEIYSSHKTKEDNRFGLWFDISSCEIMKTKLIMDTVTYKCVRPLCTDCLIIHRDKIKLELELERKRRQDLYEQHQREKKCIIEKQRLEKIELERIAELDRIENEKKKKEKELENEKKEKEEELERKRIENERKRIENERKELEREKIIRRREHEYYKNLILTHHLYIQYTKIDKKV